ncbi:MAG: hypothetical protein K6G15_03125 [Desulfovibrio sp.]|nr:hypothetical protein [Desulfovibrio sp.]
MPVTMPYMGSVPIIPPVFEGRFRTVIHAFDKMEWNCGPLALSATQPVLFENVSKARLTIDSVLESMQNLHDRFERLSVWLRKECHNPEKRQVELALLTMLRGLQQLLSDMQVQWEKFPEAVHIVTRNQIDDIERLIGIYNLSCASYESYLAEEEHFSLKGSMLNNSVQGYKLTASIRVHVEDDDTGKHASCLEIPQVYGFGETESEALAMLEREILSLYEDLQEDVPLSEEYRLLREQLDALFNNEK